MLEGIFEGIKSFLGDTLTSVLEAVLNATVFKLLYYAEIALCWLIDQLYDMFEVFAGLVRIKYDGGYSYLIDVFFTNYVVSNVYWAMALIGIALTFGFAIWAVIRKAFDIDGKQQQSLGQIIGAGIRSIILIVSMTLVISVVLRMTNTLMEQVDYIFNNASHLNFAEERDFSEEEYAAMGRILANIGNASMVPNCKNRYNVNLCYNEIRGDMLYLQQQGVFMYSYYQIDQNGNEIKSWQSVLSQIARSTDLRYDTKIDVYNQGIMTSVGAAMDYLQSGGTIAPVSHVSTFYKSDGKAHLDRMTFLMGSMRAARNGAYNQNPGFTDALRAPYYYGEGKDIYNFDDVDDDFNIGFATDYILVFMAAFALIMDLVTILLNCVARIFNMLFLYIIAPPVIAAAPLDGGGKFKQWTIAFLVQSLSVFGTVIAMRLLLIYLPIVVSPQLTLFENRPLLNVLSKFMLIFGGFEAAKKSTSLLTGILADSAGWQAVQAGDMSSSAAGLVGGASSLAKGAAMKAGGLALKGAGKFADFATKPVQNLAKRGWEATGGKLMKAWNNLGAGDKEREKVMAEAKHSLAVDDMKQQLIAQRATQNGGGGGGSGGGSGGGNRTPPKLPPRTPSKAPAKAGGNSGGALPSNSAGKGSTGASAGKGSTGASAGKGGASKSPSSPPQKQGSAPASKAASGGGAPPSAPAPARYMGTVEEFLRDEPLPSKASSGGGAPASEAPSGGAAKAAPASPAKAPPPPKPSQGGNKGGK